MANTDVFRDEIRIKLNLVDYLSALSDYSHHMHMANNANIKMKRSLDYLIAAGGIEEAERLKSG